MRFSIIIPVYNVAPYLRECLDSVLVAAKTLSEKCAVRSEKCEAVEIICVDDGSTDGSGTILDGYAAKDRRFRVKHQKNAGVSVARNVGLDVATGDWVWFLDGDDMLSPDALEVIAKNVQDHPELDAIRIPFVEQCEPPTKWDRSNATLMSLSSWNIKRKNAFVGAPGFGPFRREKIRDLRFKSFRWFEDILFTISFLRSCGEVGELACPLYFYRQRPGSAVRSNRTVPEMRSIFECQRLAFQELELWSAHNPDKEFRAVWKAFHGLVYFTFFCQYFSMLPRERKELLKEWLEMQYLCYGKYPVSFEWRIRIALVKLFNSGYLVKPLVLRGSSFRGRVKRVIMGLRGRS